MKLVRQGKISFLQPGNLSANVVGGFTTRNGGVSRQPYNSLNLGLESGDELAHVDGNRSTFARSFNLAPHQLLTVKQVHGKDILLIDEANPDLSHFLNLEVDAIVTNQRDIVIGVLTADCLPVLLWHPEKEIIAAAHIGWRGAANGLLNKTIETICQHFSCQTQELFAAIGPGIAAHQFEVDRPVRDAFRKGTGFWDQIATETSLGHWQVNLQLSCQLQLEHLGLQQQHIECSEKCTCCHPELFFSYRRDQGKTGRQLGFIKLAQ
jgi:YfiH family protein